MQFVPMATIYAIASLIALSRRGSEQTRSQGFRRWRRMNLWLVGAIVAAFVLADIDWSIPGGPPRTLMGLAGYYLLPCIIIAWIIAALTSYLRARAARRIAPPRDPQLPWHDDPRRT
jgi:uncharacterized membrane protein YeaQ/YmgE (transglycosylase-associated protein family)